MSKHGNIPIPNRLYMMKKNQRSTTEEEKAVFFGNQECPEIMEQITLYQDDRLAIVEDIHNLNQDYTARIEAFIALLCQQGKGSVYIYDQQYEVKENDRKRMLGHKFMDVTNEVYGHRALEDLRKEIEKIPCLKCVENGTLKSSQKEQIFEIIQGKKMA